MKCLLCCFVSVTQLLERISEVVEENRLFTSDSPGFGRELETLQQHLDSLSSTPLPPDSYLNKSQGLTLCLFLDLQNHCNSISSMNQNKCLPKMGVLNILMTR